MLLQHTGNVFKEYNVHWKDALPVKFYSSLCNECLEVSKYCSTTVTKQQSFSFSMHVRLHLVFHPLLLFGLSVFSPAKTVPFPSGIPILGEMPGMHKQKTSVTKPSSTNQTPKSSWLTSLTSKCPSRPPPLNYSVYTGPPRHNSLPSPAQRCLPLPEDLHLLPLLTILSTMKI